MSMQSLGGAVRQSSARVPLSTILAAVVVGLWVLAGLTAPLIAPYDPDAVDIASAMAGPGSAHWFGADQVGRDIFSRVLFAARVDLVICLLGVLPSLTIGTMIGLFSGYYRGSIDAALMRLYDLTAAFPFFVLVLAIVGVLGPGLLNFFVAVALVGWVTYARLVRAEVLVIRNSEYVQAAQCLGYSDRVILFSHILPNAWVPILGYAFSDAVLVMLAGASFGFLGMGAQPPLAEWGRMIAEGVPFLRQAWWVSFFPGAAAVSLGLGLTFLADGIAAFHRRQGGVA